MNLAASTPDGAFNAYNPLPKQWAATRCPALEVLYGGDKGAAKTHWLVGTWLPLLDLARRRHEATGRKQHRCRIVIFRKNLDDLKDFLAKSREIYPAFDPQMGEDGYHINDKTWTFTSGATLSLRHLDGPEDYRGYHGQELVGVGFDQVEQIPYEAYSFIVANCRSGDPEYHAVRRVNCTANPGGHDWIIGHFGIDKDPEGGKILTIEVTNKDGSKHQIRRAFIRARLRDNPYLPPDYEAHLRANMNEDEIAMYLEGDFFRVAGAFFSKLLRPSVHFRKSIPIPGSWDMRFSLDWGSSNPACLLIGAKDNDGRLWVIDEIHKPGITGEKFGEDMAEKWRNQTWSNERHFAVSDFWGVIDKQAMDGYGSEATAGDGIAKWGFRVFNANKRRETGCNAMKERMLMDRHGNPRVVIFEDRCPALCRALSAIESQAPKAPDDYKDNSPYSHAIDAFRFLCMEFPVERRIETTAAEQDMKKWERLIAVARGRQQREHSASGGYD